MYATKRNVVFEDEPPVTSRAALVLLNAYMSEQERAEWNAFRLQFLRASSMTCEYCQKAGLTEELVPGKGFYLLATLDHKLAISKGGSRYDTSNIAVACFPCNKSKADSLLEVWLSRKNKNP